MVTYRMTDAAKFDLSMMAGTDVVAGYIGGPNAYRTWRDSEWAACGSKPRFPIWVPKPNATAADARGADIYGIVNALIHYDIPRGQAIGFDLETSEADASYMAEMIACLHYLGMGIIAYGSTSTIHKSAGGAWIWNADWDNGPAHISPGSAGTQWERGDVFDTSEITEAFYKYCVWHG